MTLEQERFNLEDKGFVVVAGSLDIANSVVLEAATMGAKVVLCSPTELEDAGEDVISEAYASGIGDRVTFMQADTNSEVGVDHFFDAALEELGEVHVFVEFVEIDREAISKPLIETSLAEWNSVLSSNLRQPFLLSRRVITEFLAQGGGGRIVFVSHARMSEMAGEVCTTAARTALGAFIRSVTKEYGNRGIACNGVFFSDQSHPGAAALLNAQDPSHMSLGTPMQLINTSGAIAELVLFLASEEASFVNGEVIHLKDQIISHYHKHFSAEV
jgi:3-oxoacyl-[acyl-carrier protein] reductase